MSEITGEISDGFHTFNELYEYRMLYNAAFFDMLFSSDKGHLTSSPYKPHKSKRHSDGELCFGGGWFIVMAQLPSGQISNHYELKDWDLFNIPEQEKADEYDGHTPKEAAERLREHLKAHSSGRLVTDPEEIYRLLLSDPAFTEAAHKDDQGIYILGADGTKRYITELRMTED